MKDLISCFPNAGWCGAQVLTACLAHGYRIGVFLQDEERTTHGAACFIEQIAITLEDIAKECNGKLPDHLVLYKPTTLLHWARIVPHMCFFQHLSQDTPSRLSLATTCKKDIHMRMLTSSWENSCPSCVEVHGKHLGSSLKCWAKVCVLEQLMCGKRSCSKNWRLSVTGNIGWHLLVWRSTTLSKAMGTNRQLTVSPTRGMQTWPLWNAAKSG